MEPLIYVMAIFGCTDGASQCAEARLANNRFASKAQCERAVEDVLMRSTDLSAPTIAARCVSQARYLAAARDRRSATLKLAALPIAD